MEENPTREVVIRNHLEFVLLQSDFFFCEFDVVILSLISPGSEVGQNKKYKTQLRNRKILESSIM